jgi:hypothetical protein
VAILIAVFVLDADFHSTPRRIFVVITPAVAIAVIIGTHAPTVTYCTMVLVHIAVHIPHSSHVGLARAPHFVAIALLRPPIAIDPSVIGALPVLLFGLLRLLGRSLWLHGSSLGLAQSRRLSLVLGE